MSKYKNFKIDEARNARLILTDGNLKMSDGSDVTAYLKSYMEAAKMEDGAPVFLVPEGTLNNMVLELALSRVA